MHTKVAFSTTDTAMQRLYDTACERCMGNLQFFDGRQVLVEGGGYEKIWLETQPMGGEMYAKRNMDTAVNNVRFFMRCQRADGRLPGSIRKTPQGVEAQFDKLQGFCFAHHALNMYYWLGRDEAWLDEVYRSLEAFDAYLWHTRDTDGDGCLESFCVYDTGEDRAVRYGDAPCYCPTDTPPEGSSVVPMASMDLTSFSYAARDVLSRICQLRGKADPWRAKAQQAAQALKARLWDEARGACFDRDRSGRTIPILVHNNLRCMYWGSFSQQMADRFVRDHLLNPQEFWTNLPLPSVAVNDPAFRNAPENNWSGQAEGLTYQRAIQALENYGFEPLVTRLGHKLFTAVIRSGYVFAQQFDPFTGKASLVSTRTLAPLEKGSDDPVQNAYGPTLLAVLEYMAHIYGVHMHMGQMWFSLGSGLRYEYEQQWNGSRYLIRSDGSRAQIIINGQKRFESPCGVRIITDEQGHFIASRNIENKE